MRIGIPLLQEEINGRCGWIAGLHYVKSCLNALATLNTPLIEEVIVFIPSDFSERLLSSDFDKEVSWLTQVKVPEQSPEETRKLMDTYHCDFFFPQVSIPTIDYPSKCIGWVPDFQYKYLPECYSQEGIDFADYISVFLATYCSKMICISHDVKNDYNQFFPEFNNAVAVQFRVSFSSDELDNDPNTVREKYNLPKKFIYFSAQFWKHKNHKLVFEAWKELIEQGCDYTLVCSGAPRDNRDPDYFPKLEAMMKKNNLTKNIRILGFIDRTEQIQLFRCASAVLQASLFEGWSTTIEEATALGKPLIVSDLDIHHEQCENRAFYFSKNDPQNLATLLKQKWGELPDGFDLQHETKAREQYANLIKTFAQELMALFQSVIEDTQQPNKLLQQLILQNMQLKAKEEVISNLTKVCKEREALILKPGPQLAQSKNLARKKLASLFSKIKRRLAQMR
jgi:glycosyltransferase involved in cell wall biosynthesis